VSELNHEEGEMNPATSGSIDREADTTPGRAMALPRHERHSAWTIALHWSSVIAVLVAAVAALWREAIEETALRNLLMDVHRQAGLYVLVALGMRLVVRFTVGMADVTKDMHVLLRWAAQGAHAALYVVLFVLPMLGWAGSSAHGVPLRLFGLLPLPSLVEDDPDVADTLTDYHLWAAWALLGLVLMHIGAAIWHHLVRRDGVLAAMAPWVHRKRRS
jgi:cytochrome b561